MELWGQRKPRIGLASLVLLLAAFLWGACVRGGFQSQPQPRCPAGDRCDAAAAGDAGAAGDGDGQTSCVGDSPCDDGDPCTDNDRCSSGSCQGTVQLGFCRDRGFGSKGLAVVADGEVDNAGYALGALAVQSDGRLIVAGAGGTAANRDFLVARLTDKGVLDPSFSKDGKLLVDIQGGSDQVKALVLTATGTVVAGSSAGAIGVAAIDKAGVLDASFGKGGKLRIDAAGVTAVVNTMAGAANGKLILAGHARQATGQPVGLVALRLGKDGALDPTFNQQGWLHQGYTRDTFGGLIVQDSASYLYLAGSRIGLKGSTRDAVVSRFLPNGTLDLSWGQKGHYAEDSAGQDESVLVLLVGPNTNTNTIYLVGTSYPDGGLAQGFVTRLKDGAPDPTFGVKGRRLIAASYAVQLHAALLLADGQIWVGGAATDAATKKDVLLVSLDKDGRVLETKTSHLGSDDEVIWSLVPGPNNAVYAKVHQNDGVHERIAIVRFYHRN